MMSNIGENGSKRTLSTKERIFEKDEMNLRAVKADWTEEDLLRQEGVFYLKDVANKLNVSSALLKKKARALERAGKSSWQEMGIRKTWTHWYARMKIFSIYFRSIQDQRIQRVNQNWNANDMLSKKGRFFLSDVCKKLPFKPHQIRYQVKSNKDHRREFGVWKEPQHKSYLVDMEVFSAWIKQTWDTGCRARN